MKKAALILTAVMTAALLGACGTSSASTSTASTTSESTGSEAAASEEKAEATAADTYTFDLNGTEIVMNAEMAPVVEALGEADKYFESQSCAFQGLDKVYTYGSVVINTYPKDEVDYILSVELKDDTVETSEGIAIGSSKDDVIAAYGDATEENDTSLSYTKGDCTLAFIFSDGTVTNITYTAITE